MDGKFVAIKMHFGELGNLAFLRLNYAKAVADLCKEQEDFRSSQTATLYPGSRKNASGKNVKLAISIIELFDIFGFNNSH